MPPAVAPVFAGQRHDLSRHRIFIRSVKHLKIIIPQRRRI